MLPPEPPRLSLGHFPTPLRALDARALSALELPSHLKLWIKHDDLSGFALSGNKVRKLEFLLADAKQRGASAVVTCGGVQSNHCRATAFACAQLGLACTLLLRDDPGPGGAVTHNQGNHFLDQFCGAETRVFSPRDYRALDEHFAEAIRDLEQRGHRAYAIPTGGSNGLGVWGYVRAFDELMQQCEAQDFQPDMLVCASGSGGTQAGLSLAAHVRAPTVKVHAYAVCDSVSYFDRKAREDIGACMAACGHEGRIDPEAVALSTDDDFIGPGYAQGYPELYQTMLLAGRSCGLLLDPVYSGKAFHGMVTQLRAGAFPGVEHVVFMHTGGGFGTLVHGAAMLEALGSHQNNAQNGSL